MHFVFQTFAYLSSNCAEQGVQKYNQRRQQCCEVEGELSAQVQVFVKVMICDICELFAIVKMMNYVDNVLMRTDSLSSSRKFHMVPVAPPTRQLRAVPVTQITDVCAQELIMTSVLLCKIPTSSKSRCPMSHTATRTRCLVIPATTKTRFHPHPELHLVPKSDMQHTRG